MWLPRSFKSAQAVHNVASLQAALAQPALAKFHVPIYRSSQQGRQCQDGTLNAVHGGGFSTGIFSARAPRWTWCGLLSHHSWLSPESSPAIMQTEQDAQDNMKLGFGFFLSFTVANKWLILQKDLDFRLVLIRDLLPSILALHCCCWISIALILSV